VFFVHKQEMKKQNTENIRYFSSFEEIKIDNVKLNNYSIKHNLYNHK